MDNVSLVQVIDSIEHLSDGLCRILFRELALLAYAIEKLSAGSELSNDVVLILSKVSDIALENS